MIRIGSHVKPQKQLVRHDPANGKFGDCYRTAVAVVLGCDASEIPHVCEKGRRNADDLDGLIAMREFLRSNGLAISKSVFNGELTWTAFREWMAKFNPDTAFIATGQSTRGVNHCVVMIGGEVVCDPFSGVADQDALTRSATEDGESHWWVEVIHHISKRGEQNALDT